MAQAHLRRAEKLMENRAGSVAVIHALTFLQALLFFALLCVIGLIVGLTATRGVTQISRGFAETVGLKRLHRLTPRMPAFNTVWPIVVPDTGLDSLVVSGLNSNVATHRFLAGVIDGLIRVCPPLAETQSALVALIGAGLVLMLALAAVVRQRRRLALRAVERASSGLRSQVHRQMYRLGQTALPGDGLGSVVNLFSRDVTEVRDGLYAELVNGLFTPLLAAGLLALALLLSPSLTVFILSLAGIIWLVSIPLERARRAKMDAASRAAAIHMLQLHEDLGMLRTVRVFGAEPVDKHRFDEQLALYDAAEHQRLLHGVNRSPMLVLCIAAGSLLTLGMISHAVLSRQIGLHTGMLLAIALAGLAWPVLSWLRLRQDLAAATRASRGIFEFLDRKPELQMNVGASFLPPIRDRIVFERVAVEGPTGRPLLASVSATIPARSRSAVLGLDEDAKHAFVCLIPRLIDPRKGHVRIDGADVREVTLESLRAQVSMLLQADYVFSDSVLNNIGLGDPSYTLPRIMEAAKIAHAHHFIQELPNSYETVIGPLGHPLDLDEQYRVALARAYLHDPSIVVIEEPNAAFDEDTRHLFDDTVDRLAKGRTIIFLPHRLSTIRKCDQVIVLHNGRVEAAGPPREVHERSQLYRHIQYVEFNQFALGEIEAGEFR
jgi:ABC-type multidrug transport system fused ATPase/permease subunit